jgi:hypothetical protein
MKKGLPCKLIRNTLRLLKDMNEAFQSGPVHIADRDGAYISATEIGHLKSWDGS